MNYLGGLTAAWTAMNMRIKKGINKPVVERNYLPLIYFISFLIGVTIGLLIFS